MPTLTVRLPALHKGQRQVRDHPARFHVMACGRRWGKTRLGTAMCIKVAGDGGRAWWVAPSYKMAAVGWRLLRQLAAPIPGIVKSETDRSLIFPGGGSVQVRSADDPQSLRGEGLDFLVIDECAFMKEEAWTEALRPALSDRKGRALFISTPKGRNWFWRLWIRGREDGVEWQSWRFPTTANPYIDPLEVEAAAAGLPEVVFRQEYLAEFVEEGVQLFLESWFHDRYDATDRAPANRTIGRYLSWDTGFKDKDTSAYSACTVGEMLPDYTLHIREVWRGKLAFPALIHEMERLANQHNRDRKLKAVLIEDKASGTSAYQTLTASSHQLAELVIPFQPGNHSKEQRAAQASVWCRNRMVKLPHPSDEVPWLHDFEEELFAVPDAAYWDQVDSFSQLVLYLEHYLAEGLRAQQGQAA